MTPKNPPKPKTFTSYASRSEGGYSQGYNQGDLSRCTWLKANESDCKVLPGGNKAVEPDELPDYTGLA